MSMVNVEEGMFAYGVTPKSKREGVIGWISKINYEKKKVAISYRDGRTATWNVNNIVVAHEEEAYEEGVTTCELYLQFVQRHARRTYQNRRSYRERYVDIESVPRTVPPDEYPVAVEAVPVSPIRNRVNGNVAAESGTEVAAAINQLADSVRQLLNITRETSDRLHGVEDRLARVEAEGSDAMSGATTQDETMAGGVQNRQPVGNL